MQFTNTLAVTACTAVLLTACGKSDDSGNKNTSQQEKTNEETKVKPKEKVVKPDDMYSIDQFLDTSVMGLKPLMTRDEVRQTLESKGFDIPTSGGFMGANKTPLGIECDDSTTDPCKRIGYSQQYATYSIREDLESDAPAEKILPFFFVDRNGVQRLYQVKYERKFSEPIYAPNMLDTFKKRYGKPTRENISGSSDEKEVSLSYKVFNTLPRGETYQDVRAQRDSTVFYGNNLIKAASKSRNKCLKDRINEYTEKWDDWCSYLMELDPYDTHLFFATSEDSEALDIRISSTEVTVGIIGRFLPEAARSFARELKLKEQLNALEQRRNKKVEGLDDL